ncbi:Cut9-interacting protein scn1 [Microbotryomycetes sp. JL221]|nr:Cut9-interacting protein scn1 [Microbotryomycetes sp. JL221]
MSPDERIISRLTDAHCHPADDVTLESAVHNIRQSKLKTICAMSSNLDNQQRTAHIHEHDPQRVIPFFGIHPWFVHSIAITSDDEPTPTKVQHYTRLFSSSSSSSSSSEPHPQLTTQMLNSLPDIVRQQDWLTQLEQRLKQNSLAMVGEIGLDKSFKIPNPRPPCPVVSKESLVDDPSSLKPLPKHSNLQTSIQHQLEVLKSQINLAIRLKRNVSLHCVRSTKEMVDLFNYFSDHVEGFKSINLCLHSLGASPETVQQIQKSKFGVC